MIRFLTIKDGHEDGVNALIPIQEGMEKELETTIEHMEDGRLDGEEIKITCGSMTDEEYRENSIKSIMYGDGCTREEAIEILDDDLPKEMSTMHGAESSL